MMNLRIERFIADFPRPATISPAPALLLAAGLPASGKSFFVHELTTYVALAHLNTDHIRHALSVGKPKFDGEENYLVHTTAARLAAQLLEEGYHVVYDATSVLARDRRSALSAAKNVSARTVIVWCEADDQVAAQRLALRAAAADERDYSRADAAVRARMAGRHSRPAAHEADMIFYVTPDNVLLIAREVASHLTSNAKPLFAESAQPTPPTTQLD